MGFQKRDTPHLTCCLPAVMKTVRAISKFTQSWSSRTAGLLLVGRVKALPVVLLPEPKAGVLALPVESSVGS